MAADTILITDGSAHNITGLGGWAAIVRSSKGILELTGFASPTTSNRMEMMAAIQGLKSIKEPSSVVLISDSAYLLNTLKFGWYNRWLIEEGMKYAKPRPNMDLWKDLIGLTSFHRVQYVKVKGHSGDYWNERVDKLAGQARKEQSASAQMLPGLDPFDAIEWLKEHDYIGELAL